MAEFKFPPLRVPRASGEPSCGSPAACGNIRSDRDQCGRKGCTCGEKTKHPRGPSGALTSGVGVRSGDPNECTPTASLNEARLQSTLVSSTIDRTSKESLADLQISCQRGDLAMGLARSPASVLVDKLSGHGYQPVNSISYETTLNKPPYLGIIGRKDWLDPQTQLLIHIPKDDRVYVASAATAPYNLIVQLSMTLDGKPGFGSGAIIGPRHVLTAAHNLYSKTRNKPLSNVEVHTANGKKFTVAQRYVSDCFILHAPSTSFGDSNALQFARYDLAVVTTTQDMVGPKDEVFNYNAPTDKDWLIGRLATTIGIPGPSRPCRAEGTTVPVSPEFGGLPFGKCKGIMVEQSLKLPKPGYTTNVIRHYFDIVGGQSGSPIFIESGGVRTIYGIMSVASESLGNLAHRLSEKGVDYIAFAVDDSS